MSHQAGTQEHSTDHLQTDSLSSTRPTNKQVIDLTQKHWQSYKPFGPGQAGLYNFEKPSGWAGPGRVITGPGRLTYGP